MNLSFRAKSRNRLILIFFLIIFFLSIQPIFALENCGNQPSAKEELEKYSDCLNRNIVELQNQGFTLKAAIETISSKIRLTQAQITRTTNQIVSLENDIENLTTVVSDLDESLDKLAKVYVARVQESYKHRKPDPLTLFLGSNNFAKFFTTLRYLNIVKARDQLILSEITNAKNNFDAQKNEKIEKQKQVEELKTSLVAQQASLSNQQKSKQKLLADTQNDEKKFQTLLAQARAELEAINAIVGGQGQEVEVGDISQGAVIAKLIQGASCNSGGQHLHFMVADNNSIQNPFNYLKSVDFENCSGSSCGGSDGDPFNPIGSWDWPLNPKIQFNQGYGMTWAVKNTWVGRVYSAHSGIDIGSDSIDVKAVAAGKLYRGTYSGINSCALKYVRVAHREGNFSTFYLHVNYTL